MGVNIDVSLDLTKLLIDPFSPVLTRVGETVISLWNLTFGLIDFTNEHARILMKHHLEKFRDRVYDNTSSIPAEDLQMPALHIIGPALESSKYYYSEPELRELFAKLIASSMRKSLSSVLHTSFTEVIRQMEPLDAKLLRHIGFRPLPTATFKLFFEDRFHYKALFEHTFADMEQFGSYEEIQSSFSNLKRLGIIDIIDHEHLADLTCYDFAESSHFKEIAEAAARNSEQVSECGVSYGVIRTTKYGDNFMKTCVHKYIVSEAATQ